MHILYFFNIIFYLLYFVLYIAVFKLYIIYFCFDLLYIRSLHLRRGYLAFYATFDKILADVQLTVGSRGIKFHSWMNGLLGGPQLVS